ncbi:MAG: efflux RND transporter permease subunit [Rhabdochlamydiaceae bacterium]|nr:efflux RND transporter permease subunit [Candidatus Amphrikana amoebophyrae]
MSLSKPFILRPVMTSLIVVSLFFFGVFAYNFLPVSDLPSIQYPTIQVKVSYPGASPATMANTVAAPLERQFAQIQKIKSIFSSSQNGQTLLVLQFDLSQDVNVAAQDVQAQITASLSYLPSDLPNQPIYRKYNPTESPVIYFAFASQSFEPYDIYKYVDAFAMRRFSMLSGVSDVNVYGSAFAVRVQIDPEKLAARKININQVAEVIKTGNVEYPTGTLYGPNKEFTILATGQIFDAEGYNQLIVRNEDGEMVRIKDLGNAINSSIDNKMGITLFQDGKAQNAIAVGVEKMAGANTLQTIQEVENIMPSIREAIPESVEIVNLFNESVWIWEAIHDVEFTLVVAFFLVAAVTFFYLGKARDSIIPIIVMPISILGTFALMYVYQFSIDLLSLLAITLSIGFLVDDAIVVLENTVRHLEQGKTRFQAALQGSAQISFTVLSMTLCLTSVFIPMLFMGGIVGRLFREFAVTIMTVVIISGILSLTLTPLLCSRFLARHHVHNKNWLEKFSEKINKAFLAVYKKGLYFVLRHKISTLIAGMTSVALTLLLVSVLPKGFLPPDDTGIIQAFIKTEDGTSPYKTMDIAKYLGEKAMNHEYVERAVAIGGHPTSNQGIVFINLKPINERPSIFKLEPVFKEYLETIPGVEIFVKAFPLIELNIGTDSQMGNYQYSLQSFDSKVLYETAEKFMAQMKQIPGIAQVTSDMHISEPQLTIEIDRDKASNFNLTASDIEFALRYAYGGTKVSQINGEIDEYDVVLETQPIAYRDPSVLDKLYIGENQVPIKSVVNITQTIAPLEVNHLNTMPAVTFTFDLKDAPLSQVLASIEELADEMLPANVLGSVQGTANVFEETFQSLGYLILITIFCIYVILGILYENFIHPITVMSALPPAALGGLLTLYLFGETLSLYSFVGMLMLLGIVLKNGIILVDFAVEGMSKEGKTIEEAIEFACITRFRPILMTTIAAMMGAVPIASGIGGMTASSRQPLGMVIVGGLMFSQFLTLFLTPVVFIFLERLRRKFHSKKRVEMDDEPI